MDNRRSDNLSPKTVGQPERNPWFNLRSLSPLSRPIPTPNNANNDKNHPQILPSSTSKSSKTKGPPRILRRETSSSGAWSHKAEPPSAPSEITPDDNASIFTQGLAHPQPRSRYNLATPTQEQYLGERGFEDWHEEFWYALLSVLSLIGLALFLKNYDGAVLPLQFGWTGGFSFETAVVALVTFMRGCMDAYVGSAVSQGAWIWVSERAQMRRKGREVPRLGDFSLFDAASRGMSGSLELVWRLRGRHLGCVGAMIMVLGYGFEAFSQEMVTFEQQRRKFDNVTAAPVPARGIISTEIPNIAVSCETANCTWPIIPTLGACGECATITTDKTCNEAARICTYSTASGTSIQNPMDSGERDAFIVSPSNGTLHQINTTSRAYFSVFDLISISQSTDQGTMVSAAECALWFCVQAHRVTVENGVQNDTIVANHSTATLSLTNSAHGGEHAFVNIPKLFNTDNSTRYAVTHEAMLALRNFMASITVGTVLTTLNTIDSSSDWVEAMSNATSWDLSQWIETFALSLTNEFRLHGSVSSTSSARYAGEATQLTPVVKVHWMWLFYPGFMILLSLYFFLHTFIACSRDGICGWKGGVLPLLFCAVDEGIYDKGQGGMEIPGGLEERVAGVRVAMFRELEGKDEDGKEKVRWGFRTVDEDEDLRERERGKERVMDEGVLEN
ncbi:hypothetical protein QBC38DRAFT_508850 [Podospora fimiseda]|uniref:Uncharacterized protein n=1 Tax=Podospora fimiseda TaxID=252190 RepID=A0AAN7H5N4_9PEZI|nr:hypothetical protein QBC38DRAFT_508850 [Podospora fimiseda]